MSKPYIDIEPFTIFMDEPTTVKEIFERYNDLVFHAQGKNMPIAKYFASFWGLCYPAICKARMN